MDARGAGVGTEGWGQQANNGGGPDLNDSGTDTDEDGQLIQQANQSRPPEAPAPQTKRPKKPAGAITLKELIDAGLLTPGSDTLLIDYKGSQTKAALAHDGAITWRDMSFDSPSAFSIYLKRLVNPGRKADDGWKTVKYNGKYLEHYKMQLVMRRVREPGISAEPSPPATVPDEKRAASKPVTKKAKVDVSDTTHAIMALKAMTSEPNKPRRIKIKLKGPSLSKATAEPVEISYHMHDFAPRDGDSSYFKANKNRDKVRSQDDNVTTLATHTGKSLVESHNEQPNHATLNDQSMTLQPDDAANNRPKRQVKVPQRLAAPHGKHDGHSMVACEMYKGSPNCGDPAAQPFKIELAPAVEVMIDFHAHLDHNEIIGLLAGHWDTRTKTLSVLRAFPVKELNASADNSNVEMDPVDQSMVQEVIEQGYFMKVVGWYHSHPSFHALPSIIDISNQFSFQKFRESEGEYQPYIATIVSPYDRKMTGVQSSFCWFHVKSDANAVIDVDGDPISQGVLPYELTIEKLVTQDSSSQLIKLVNQLRTLAERYTTKLSRVDLDAAWLEGGTRRHKLLSSVCSWLPSIFSEAQRQQYAMMVSNALTLAATAKMAKRPKSRSQGRVTFKKSKEADLQQQTSNKVSSLSDDLNRPSTREENMNVQGVSKEPHTKIQEILHTRDESWNGTEKGRVTGNANQVLHRVANLYSGKFAGAESYEQSGKGTDEGDKRARSLIEGSDTDESLTSASSLKEDMVNADAVSNGNLH